MFQELLQSLRQQMLKPFMQGMQQAMSNMSPQDMQRMREMIQDLNRMLRDRAEGDEPDFQAFKDKWGQNFPGVENLDQLLEQMGKQMAQMQSLMESMTPGQRRELQDMMQSLLAQDERLDAALAQLAMNLDQLMPLDEMRRRYDFKGDDPLTLREAMQLMDELAQMEQLERQLRKAQDPASLEKIDPAEVEKLLGEQAAQDLKRLAEMSKKLEEAGYLERIGDRLELTARAIRKIADKALHDVFSHLKRDRFGRHVVDHRGAGGDRTDDAKRYEFGDPFLLDLKETLMNAVERRGPGTPVRLVPDDFEVFRTELLTQSATVVMLDLSRSMIYNGCFMPAKKVALALHALIRGQFPRDQLHIVGFSLYAREFTADQLPALGPSDSAVGTNMQAGFVLARQLLAKRKCANKQIIMITDGEPTAHLEGAEAEFSYPHPAHDPRDAQRGQAVHARRHHDQYLHARAERHAHRVRRADDADQSRAGVLCDARAVGRVRVGRLRECEAQGGVVTASRCVPSSVCRQSAGRGGGSPTRHADSLPVFATRKGPRD